MIYSKPIVQEKVAGKQLNIEKLLSDIGQKIILLENGIYLCQYKFKKSEIFANLTKLSQLERLKYRFCSHV